ncbi:MAG: YeeE/YedE family protein [Rubrivivax sp.]|nr:YeeE/YedE family protein [Rubrivivax sp.]
MSGSASPLALWVLGGGFALAFVFGAVAARSNFCTMGAISDVVNMGHWGRVRMWLLAIAVAVAGTTALQLQGVADIARSVPLRPNLPWLSLLLGGFVFGIGMTLAGGCANKNLVRLGGGSVRSLVVLVFMGLASYMTLKGLLAQFRASWLDPVALPLGERGWADQSLGTALAQLGAGTPKTSLAIAAALIVLALLVFVFKDARFRADRVKWLSGLAIGALIVGGWYVTGHLGYGENPETLETVYFATNTRTLESLSFVAPVAYSIELLSLWTDASLKPSFGIAAVAGVVCGSAAYALATRSFRWEGFASMQDLRNQLIGAVLMGFGGVTAIGCTVGQGLTGLSTLALGSMLAVTAIVAGSVATLKYLLWQAERED